MKNKIIENKLGFCKYYPENDIINEEIKLIFVHGLGGSIKSWKKFPQKLHKEISLSSVWHFSYNSGFKRIRAFASKQFNLDVLVLADSIKHDNSTSKLFFFAHSQGGLLTLLMIRKLYERKDFDTLKRISGIFFFNSPLAGSKWAHFASLIPGLKVDARILIPGSNELSDLKNFVFRNINFNEESSGSNDKLDIPAFGISASKDDFVTPFSSSLYIPEDQCHTFFGNHSSLIKSIDSNDKVIQWVLRCLRKILNKNININKNNYPSKKMYKYDLTTDSAVEEFMAKCKTAFDNKKYSLYYDLLRINSLALKRCGKHSELAELCLLDVKRKASSNMYPTLTYSQVKLTKRELIKAFNALQQQIIRNPRLKKNRPQMRLLFSRTYSEILIEAGHSSLAIKLLEGILSSSEMARTKYNNVSHALGVLAKSYLTNGDIEEAIDLYKANLAEAELTNNKQGIAIAQMNYGISLLKLENEKHNEDMFLLAKDAFHNVDIRAEAWAKLYISYFRILHSQEDYEELAQEALEYNAIHHQCSREYSILLSSMKQLLAKDTNLYKNVTNEIERCSNSIKLEVLTEQNLIDAENTVNAIIYKTTKKGADPLNFRVSLGGFKARSVLVKSFKNSLNTEKIEEYLLKISKDTNSIANTFYNDLLILLCKKKPSLISKYILPKLSSIADQSDSIKLFYARFFESERLTKECSELLARVEDKNDYAYLNCQANFFATKLSTFPEALIFYKKAFHSTRISQNKAISLCNMAHVIHEHRQKGLYSKAIEYCDESITYRSGSNFFYPASLKIAIMIELANFDEIESIITKGIKELGLYGKSIEYALGKIHDRAKLKRTQQIIEGVST